LHGIVSSKALLWKSVVRMKPKSQGPWIEIHDSTEISSQEIKIFDKLIYFLVFNNYSITVLLWKYMLDLLFGVDKIEDNLSVFWNSCCPYYWLTLLLEIVQEIIEIFTFIDTQQSIKAIQLFIEIVGTKGSQQVSLFIRGEGINEKLVHLHNYSKFSVILFWRKQSWLGLIVF